MTPGDAFVDIGSRHPRLVRRTLLWAAVAVVVPVVRGDGRVWAYLVVLALLATGVALIGARGRLSGATLSALSVLGALHAVGGLVPAPGIPGAPFYDAWLLDGILRYDQLVHAVGSIIMGAAAFELLGGLVDPDRCSAVVRAWLAALLTCGLGALNEVAEFLAAQRIAGLHIGDGANAAWDLVFNGAGALSLVAFVTAQERARRRLRAASSRGQLVG